MRSPLFPWRRISGPLGSRPELLSPFYTNNASFDRSEIRSVQLMKLLLERGMDWGYYLELSKSLFIKDLLDIEEAAW